MGIFTGMNSSSQTAPAASNYRWVICGLLFFATTFNYLDRQVISYLKEFFCAPAELTSSFSTISANDLKLPDFAAKLSHPTDAVSTFIKTNLSAPTLVALENYSDADPVPLATNLVRNLNTLITNQTIYDVQRFAGVTLRPETQKLIALNPSGIEIAHLNRL